MTKDIIDDCFYRRPDNIRGLLNVEEDAGIVSSASRRLVGPVGLANTSSSQNMTNNISISIRGYSINFYMYANISGFREKTSQLERFFSRLPDQHLAVLYPIFIMEKKPGGRQGGGTWRPEEVRSNFMRDGHVRNTGIPNADIERLVINSGKGLIGLSEDRWQRPIGRLKFTVFHEIAHCVDYSFQPNGLVPAGSEVSDFAGMETDRCGAGNGMVRRAVEVYARYICTPSRIFHTSILTESNDQTNQRLIRTLRGSPAFRSVSSTWAPL